MQDPPQGSQTHRHDEVLPDGVWYDHVDQADCSRAPVIAALPERRPPEVIPVTDEPAEDTWTDNSPVRNRRDIDFRTQQRHENRMQSQALVGVGVLFLITLAVVIVASWVGAISEDFARTLAQMILPALLASGATIIGTLFKPK